MANYELVAKIGLTTEVKLFKSLIVFSWTASVRNIKSRLLLPVSRALDQAMLPTTSKPLPQHRKERTMESFMTAASRKRDKNEFLIFKVFLQISKFQR